MDPRRKVDVTWMAWNTDRRSQQEIDLSSKILWPVPRDQNFSKLKMTESVDNLPEKRKQCEPSSSTSKKLKPAVEPATFELDWSIEGVSGLISPDPKASKRDSIKGILI